MEPEVYIMKMLKILIAATVLVAGAASAITVEDIDTPRSNIHVKVVDGVATLWGTVNKGSERKMAENDALQLQGGFSTKTPDNLH